MPIADSSITLFAAGATGYGAGATAIGTATTNAGGAFTVASYTCPAGNPQTYITATGGDAGSGANSAIALMAALGPCNSLTPSTSVTINELTTAAAQWALAQFFDPTGHNIGTSSTNAIGLQNAYAGIANLADIDASNLSVSGNPSSFLPNARSCPLATNCDGLERLNTLANILAGCIESSGSSSSACAALLCDATPGHAYSAGSCSETPTLTDTMGAAHLIVTNPSNNASALYALAAASKPFIPALGAAPDGWEIALHFAPSGASFNNPFRVALDASGNVFVANASGNSVSELTTSSAYRTGLHFAPSGASFDLPYGLALDGSANVFVPNALGNSVSELTSGSGYATGLNFTPSGASFDAPDSIALDGTGNVFVGNYYGDTMSELTVASGYATGLNFASPDLYASSSIALDGSGDAFVVTTGGVSELTAGSGYSTVLTFDPLDALFNDAAFLTLDGSANVFVVNETGLSNDGSVSELTAGTYATGLNFAPLEAAFDSPRLIALDGSGNVFVGNASRNSVSELTASSSYATGLNFAPAAAFNFAESLALDGSGNVFVANASGNSVSEMLGLAKPVITPVQSCLIYWSNNPGQACVP